MRRFIAMSSTIKTRSPLSLSGKVLASMTTEVNAVASGTSNQKRLPTPISLVTSIVPPISSTS